MQVDLVAKVSVKWEVFNYQGVGNTATLMIRTAGLEANVLLFIEHKDHAAAMAAASAEVKRFVESFCPGVQVTENNNLSDNSKLQPA